MRKFTLLVLAGLVCLSLAAVPAMAAKTIRVGASPTPHAEILRACEGILKEKGYTLEIVEYADYVRKTLESRKPARLSQPALEVLAIIAYYQPVTRAYVDQVRGVDSSYTVGLLLERDLIEESGRLAVPGRPILYRTTKTFLRSFGLSSLEELPELPSGTQEGDQMTLKLEEAVAKLKAEEAGETPEGETPPEPAEGGTP